ncbi:MAG: nucleotidyltransferase family protein [Armatimonadota bacterium]
MVDVIILGGGTVEDEALRRETGVKCKSLIPLAGRPMVEHVLAALRGTEGVGRIALVGPPALRGAVAPGLADAILEEGATRAENLYRGIDALPGSERMLLATADTPLLTPAMIGDLLHRAPDCDVCYPYVARETILRRFGAREWVFIRLRDAAFTGSSMALFRPAAFRQLRPLVEQVIGAHREHWKVARLFGLGFLLRAKLGWITVPEIERQVSAVVKLDCRGYCSPFAELAFDVDHHADLAMAREGLFGDSPNTV